MIEQIIIKGFQSHVNSIINLCPGLNVVTGASDSGKTAIIRAVRWVAFNEPLGDSFVNKGVGEAEVTIKLTGGQVTKLRSGGKTSYVVNGSTFEKAEVPAEVTNLLGLKKHTFGDFEAALNFAYQLEAPFLLSETASVGAKVLGKLSGTEVVDLAIKSVAKDQYKANADRLQAIKDTDRLTEQLKEYESIEDEKKALEQVEALFNLSSVMQAKMEHLADLLTRYEASVKAINHLIDKVACYAELPRIDTVIKSIDHDIAASIKLSTIVAKRRKVEAQYAGAKKILWSTKDMPTIAALASNTMDSLSRLDALQKLKVRHLKECSSIERHQRAIKNLENISKIDVVIPKVEAEQAERAALQKLKWKYDLRERTISEVTTALADAKEGVGMAKNELKKVMVEIKVCPMCGRDFDGCEAEA